MHGIVILHSVVDESKGRSGIRDRADPDIVALEGFHERLGHAVIRNDDFGARVFGHFLKMAVW